MLYDKRKNKWEKQPGESSRAYFNFCLYRDYGIDRSLSKVFPKKAPKKQQVVTDEKGEQKQYEPGTISKKQADSYSGKYDWQVRVQAYDTDQEREYRKKREKETMKFFERQIAAGMRFEKFRDTLLMAKFNHIAEKLRRGDQLTKKDVDDFSTFDIIRLSVEARDCQKMGLRIEDQRESVPDKIGMEHPIFTFKDEAQKLKLANLINELTDGTKDEGKGGSE
jgi:hypothetical protein